MFTRHAGLICCCHCSFQTPTALDAEKAALRAQVAAAVKKLCARLEQQGGQLTDKERLVLRLNQQYPDDVGVLAVYFLNHIRLKPDQVTNLLLTCSRCEFS